MYAPLRLVYSLRPHASAGLLAAALVAATTFLATPFLLPELVDSFDVSLGTAGLLSTAQVGSFAIASFFAGRRLRPSRAILLGSSAILVLANVASALVPVFWALTLIRMVAGVAAGLMTWVAWADAAGESRRISDVAAITPIGAVVASPLLGSLADQGGDQAIFLALALVGVVALFIPVRLAAQDAPERRKRISPSRSNRVLLLGLTMTTLFGSSVYVFAASIAQEQIGLSAAVAAGAYSVNAATGFVATRIRTRKTWAGWWLVGMAVAALSVTLIENGWAFYAAMALWGFSFWMAVPRVLRMLADRSFSPDERIGDAQAGMAVGRAIGPAAGAALLTGATVVSLGVVAASGLGLAAMAMFAVQAYRRAGGDADVVPRIKALRWRTNG